MLTAVLLSAISATKVSAQSWDRSSDSTKQHHSSTYSGGHSWFGSIFRRNTNNASTTTRSNAVRPRSGGFGTTVRVAHTSSGS
jgi:hypothetical protein